MIFMMIISKILHLDDNILMWIVMLPFLIMVYLFHFDSEMFLRDSEVFMVYDVFLYAVLMILYCQ